MQKALCQLKVSVVIPAKNRADTLPACLDSILEQTLPAAEIIVVDDSSTDNTRDVVESYGNRHVRYARLANGSGAQAARNAGIELAACDWIAFQDSDDIWLPEKLQRQVAALEERGFAEDILVHCNGIKVDSGACTRTPMNLPLTEGSCYKQLLLKAAPMFQGLLVTKKSLIKIGGLDNQCPSFQEWDTSIRLARICRFIHIQEPLFEWIWHGGETISKDMRRDVIGFQYVVDKHRNEIIRNHGARQWRKLKVMNITRALELSLWDDVQSMARNEPWHFSFALANLCARFRTIPRGTATLLRLTSPL